MFDIYNRNIPNLSVHNSCVRPHFFVATHFSEVCGLLESFFLFLSLLLLHEFDLAETLYCHIQNCLGHFYEKSNREKACAAAVFLLSNIYATYLYVWKIVFQPLSCGCTEFHRHLQCDRKCFIIHITQFKIRIWNHLIYICVCTLHVRIVHSLA